MAAKQLARPEWLIVRREADGHCHAMRSLLKDPADTSVEQLIAASCLRCWTERTFEDAKSDLGRDKFQAQKYRAWEQHFALTALAVWFIAQTKLEWRQTYTRDPDLACRLEVEVLPALCTANVRELLKAVSPLPVSTPEQVTQLVIAQLVQRARFTASRAKAREARDFL